MSLGIVIAAGGTGGHMVPAHALGEELMRRGHRVALLTDARGLRFPGLFEGVERHVLASATASGRNPLAWARALAAIARGRAKGRRLLAALKAEAVVGFGGYPSLPGLLAGISRRLTTIIHEQNAVLGRVNRRMQHRVSAVALSYAGTMGVASGVTAHVVGNPVRSAVLAAREAAFSAPGPDAPFRLLVTGGSQGARILADVVPAAVAALPSGLKNRLMVVHQCREEDLSRVAAVYRSAAVDAQCLPYMADLPQRMAAAHLVVARSGASTMAELGVIGRPAVLIPFAAATDDHQAVNAHEFVAAGAGAMVREAEATSAGISGLIRGFMESPEALAAAAAAARGLGHPDAAARLADMIEQQVARA
jgi:UDP-N-acetylglucosamine--N-acetylmuramyl-(pentapeptide) pyrophosphoryl-undecaprenol N-acetylglucosamine transferase